MQLAEVEGHSEDGMLLAENIPELLKNMLLARELLNLSFQV